MVLQWNRAPEHHGAPPALRPPSWPLRSSRRPVHSRYVQMLLEHDDMPAAHNVLAAVFAWLLLAGFLVFPGTFTDARAVKNMPLLLVAAVACGTAVLGMATLAVRHAANYVWLSNRLFVPAMANCMAGLISTLIGVYTQQHGAWGVAARATAIAQGAGLVVSGVLFLIFDRCLLRGVKKSHGSHYDAWPAERRGKDAMQ